MILFCSINGMQLIPVAANDVAFSVHAVLLTGFTLFQVLIYEVRILVHDIYYFTIVTSTTVTLMVLGFHYLALANIYG